MSKKRVLFVCIENSNRSQVAQAFAQMYGKHAVEAFSAGSRPSGKINPVAIASMQELGYDLASHSSKSVDQYRSDSFYAVVTMGCGDDCPFIPAVLREDWNIPDPRNLSLEEYREIRDLISGKVKELLGKLAAAQ